MPGEMHTRSCVRSPGWTSGSAAQLPLHDIQCQREILRHSFSYRMLAFREQPPEREKKKKFCQLPWLQRMSEKREADSPYKREETLQKCKEIFVFEVLKKFGCVPENTCTITHLNLSCHLT